MGDFAPARECPRSARESREVAGVSTATSCPLLELCQSPAGGTADCARGEQCNRPEREDRHRDFEQRTTAGLRQVIQATK